MTVVRVALILAALLLASVRLVVTQSDGQVQVLRPWRCLAGSVAGGSIFRSVVTPECPVTTSTNWPAPAGRMKFAAAIVPPASPTGLGATVNGSTVVLTWTAPTSGDAPTSYVVQAGSASGLSNLADFDTGSSMPTLTATNVALAMYFVRVLARNAAGTSAPSSEIVVQVAGSCAAPPGAPTGLSANVSGSTVVLTWQAAAGGCPATSYVIQAGSAPGLSNLANFSTGSAAPAFAANNVASGVYYVRVLAADAAGTSGASNEIVLVVNACSGPPGATSGLASLVSGSTVTLSWTDASGSPTNYLIDVGSTPGSSNLGVIDNGAATSFTASNVAAGSYYVQVQARNACGTGPASNQVVVVVGVAPVTVTILHSFTGPDGRVPHTALLLGNDGSFYGTTDSPTTSAGNIYRITRAGTFTVVHDFMGPDGAFPDAPLIQASDGNFYGTTSGGQPGFGTVFKTTPAGSLTVLHVFAGRPTDGAVPEAALIQAGDGNFYGTTLSGGSGYGTVFRMTPSGTVTLLYSFTGGADGGAPRAPVIQASDGNFYGTTQFNGASDRGTVFRLTPGGTFSLLHTFTGGSDGGLPVAGLIQGADGNLYGTASASDGSTFRGGTAFTMDLAGNFTVLHTFTDVDGKFPLASLLQASDGNFYGTTSSGGVASKGTVFVMTPAGALTVLHAFTGGTADGASPNAALIAPGDGSLYGTTTRGGASDAGTVFRISR